MRQALVRFGGAPLKAFASGALVTAPAQSSSASTVTAIGFVSAGPLTLPQALEVIMGANFGDHWHRMDRGCPGTQGERGFLRHAPRGGVGAFLGLLARGRAKSLGLALAGFGLIFVGIEPLQVGMASLAGATNLARLPTGGWVAQSVTVTLGIMLTVLMQSSSAAVATTLTALHTQAVNFEQAAWLVVGAAIGTPMTGALAAIGGSAAARRTALAHVLFNLAIGIIALVSLPGFLRAIAWAQSHLGLKADAIGLAAFRTAFIAMGASFLPFVRSLARLLERWLPETGPLLTRHLEFALLNAPAMALGATDRALQQTADQLCCSVTSHLPRAAPNAIRPNLAELSAALGRIEEFFSQIPPVFEGEPLSRQRQARLHALDHAWRLLEGAQPPPSEHRALADETLAPAIHRSREILALARSGLVGDATAGWQATLAALAHDLANPRRNERPRLLRETAAGRPHPVRTLELLDALRRLDRVGYHTWHPGHHLGGGNVQPEGRAGEPPRAAT